MHNRTIAFLCLFSLSQILTRISSQSSKLLILKMRV